MLLLLLAEAVEETMSEKMKKSAPKKLPREVADADSAVQHGVVRGAGTLETAVLRERLAIARKKHGLADD